MTGIELKNLLIEKNIVLSDVANTLGYSRQNFNSKLKGKDLGVSFVLEVCNAVNISLYTLLNLEEKSVKTREMNEPTYKDKYLNLLEDYRKLSDRLTDCLDKRK